MSEGANMEQIPKSSFGKKSTAEDVTAGLDLTGKTALITGVNSGIGFETMRVLALRGAHVIGTARTLEKAKEACAQIQGKATPLACELTDLSSVAACADEVRSMGMPLDMVICNAGIMALPTHEQVYGYEKQFATNHLGHFVLVHRLLDLVKAASQGRVVVLSSSGHKMAPPEGIEFDNLSGAEGEYKWGKAYGQSKLANGLFAMELARRFEGSKATANALHPGLINTNLVRHMSPIMTKIAGLLGKLFMKTIPQGAATTCYVATSPDLTNVSGVYFNDCNPETPSDLMQDQDLAIKLWEKSEEITRDYL